MSTTSIKTDLIFKVSKLESPWEGTKYQVMVYKAKKNFFGFIFESRLGQLSYRLSSTFGECSNGVKKEHKVVNLVDIRNALGEGKPNVHTKFPSYEDALVGIRTYRGNYALKLKNKGTKEHLITLNGDDL